MKGILDFDDNIEIKHPESKTTAICYDDLRLGPTRPFYYSVPDWARKFRLLVQGIASPLGPIKIKLVIGDSLFDTIEMNIDQSLTIDTNALTNLKTESTHELAIIASAGQGGGINHS